MIDLNHHLLTGGLGVGHKTLDEIREISGGYLFHSKLTGAGGGGCAITLIPKGFNNRLIINNNFFIYLLYYINNMIFHFYRNVISISIIIITPSYHLILVI